MRPKFERMCPCPDCFTCCCEHVKIVHNGGQEAIIEPEYRCDEERPRCTCPRESEGEPYDYDKNDDGGP